MSETSAPPLAFRSVEGRLLARVLQMGFTRYRRVQLGFVNDPGQYRLFLRTIVAPRLRDLTGRLGVFGVGSHSEVVLKAAPDLRDRITLFTDNNPDTWNGTKFGKPVLPPSEAVEMCDAFFLSTAVFQHVLKADLNALGFSGTVVAVDDYVPPEWFLADAG